MSTAQLFPVAATLILRGPCPSKKNLYRRSRDGRLFLNTEVKTRLDSLTIQARSQWNGHEPVKHPEMSVTFYFSSGRPDRDNRLSAILDCLQEAGVIFNDNAKQFNGRLVLQPAVFVSEGKEKVEVQITA
jgi:Holliday junction resolvase RusA-like endonuclease